MKVLAVAAILFGIGAGPGVAGPIDRACVQSNRSANRQLCDCIQRVANLTLTGSDQRLAASFFTDPVKAQQVRQSGQTSHKRFWDRYSKFGTTAQAVCSSS